MKNKKIIVVFGVTLLMVVLGVSYAWLSTTIFGKKEYVLKAGELDLVLDETSNGLMIEDDLPVEDNIGIQGEGATFRVRNNGSSNICYQIYLDDSDLLDQEIRVEDKFVKYSITKDGIVGSSQVLSSGRLIDNMEIGRGKSVNYKLRLWFNIEEDGEIAGQVFRGKLRIEAVQCKSSLPMMRSYTLNSQDDYHVAEYREKVSSIVTKNNTMISDSAIESWDVSERQDGSVMAYAESDGNGGYTITIGGDGGIFASTDSSCLFGEFSAVKRIDLASLNTSFAKSMYRMFFKCNSLVSIDVTTFDTTNVTNMAGMFYYCDKLVALNVSNFKTLNLDNASGMFSGCASLLSLNLGNFQTSNLIDMSYMFYGCSNLRVLDLSSFDTSKVQIMDVMFGDDISLESIIVSDKWQIGNASTTSMFTNCKTKDVTVI